MTKDACKYFNVTAKRIKVILYIIEHVYVLKITAPLHFSIPLHRIEQKTPLHCCTYHYRYHHISIYGFNSTRALIGC